MSSKGKFSRSLAGCLHFGCNRNASKTIPARLQLRARRGCQTDHPCENSDASAGRPSRLHPSPSSPSLPSLGWCLLPWPYLAPQGYKGEHSHTRQQPRVSRGRRRQEKNPIKDGVTTECETLSGGKALKSRGVSQRTGSRAPPPKVLGRKLPGEGQEGLEWRDSSPKRAPRW